MKYRTLGNSGVKLSAIGLGCMGMNHAYGNPDDDESIATLEKAIEIGVNFWDTADVYANGKNEELVSRVLAPNRKKIFIATKFGFRFGGDGQPQGFDGSAVYIRSAVEKSLQRLKIDVIDLYYAHRIDPQVPVEETVGAMSQLVQEGKVRFLGLSEASPASIRKAHAVHPISALQSEYSLLTRDVEKEIIPLCLELGISLIPFSPLARGLVSNTLNISELAANDFRRTVPRFQQEYQENNTNLTQEFARLAEAKQCTPAQLALAWVLAQGENIIPIPGTKKRKYLVENAASADIEITKPEMQSIEALLAKYPNVGERYNAEHFKFVNK